MQAGLNSPNLDAEIKKRQEQQIAAFTEELRAAQNDQQLLRLVAKGIPTVLASPNAGDELPPLPDLPDPYDPNRLPSDENVFIADILASFPTMQNGGVSE